MAENRWDDEDDWPEPEHDPEVLGHAREELARGGNELRRRVLRYVYFGLAVLVILVVVLALTR
jgi:hypothetical protein